MSEISVEMRLKLNKLRADAAKGGQEIRSGLASSVKGLPATAMEQEAQAAQRVRRNQVQKAADKMDLFRQNYDVEMATRRNRARALMRQRAEAREAAGHKRVHDNPFVNFAERRLGFSGLGAPLKAIGILGVAAIGVGAALLALKKVVGEMSAAIEDARRTYAKILQSGGMGQAFIVRRQQLAEVLGVSEEQVMQYGAAINYLNVKLNWSTKILTETNPTLTALGWQFKILDQDMKAAWATLANDAAPALMLFAKAIDGIVKSITNPKFLEFLSKMAFGTIPTLVGKVISASDSGKAPQVPTSLDRMPASTWEKMGLVIGSSGGQNHLMKIAANTKATADAVVKMAQSLVPSGNTTGMNPIAAYPAP